MPPIADHPLRYALANELHARPFPVMSCPGQAAYIAIMPEGEAGTRDKTRELAHLIALLDRHDVPHPQPEATHYFGQIGKVFLKWEQHTEFVTYTAFAEGTGDRAFDPALWDVFPDDWLAEAPGRRVTSVHLMVQSTPRYETSIVKKLSDWFVPESLAVARVLDDAAVIAGDFRISSSGHMNFAVFCKPDTGQRRIGRVVQRICEIETYKAMAMLALPRAREVGKSLAETEITLRAMTEEMTGELSGADDVLRRLLATAGGLENLMTRASFRFAAARAYEAIVNQRIAVLREERFHGQQTLAEFMARRFDPAMRTVHATEQRMASMIDRANRTGDLLRTRVDVDRQAQNQTLLESMDRRADLQLRLQRTVEGLSVVAISYYAVNLGVYLTTPLAEAADISKPLLTAGLTLPVLLGVWLIIRSIRRRMD